MNNFTFSTDVCQTNQPINYDIPKCDAYLIIYSSNGELNYKANYNDGFEGDLANIVVGMEYLRDDVIENLTELCKNGDKIMDLVCDMIEDEEDDFEPESHLPSFFDEPIIHPIQVFHRH